MATIAIIGSSFSKCLYYVKDAPDMSDWTTEEREKWALDEWPMSFILQDYENNWVNLLAKKYPQHEFHIFAEGGAGWEYSEIILHKVAELEFDRVIVELQEPRLMIYNKKSSIEKYPLKEFMLNNDYFENKKFRSKETAVFNYGIKGTFEDNGITSVCFYHKCLTTLELKVEIRKTMAWQFDRAEHFKEHFDRSRDLDDPMHPRNQQWFPFTNDVVRYIANHVTGPIYGIRYKQFLLSLKTIWPKVFDQVGVWAYISPNLPWLNFDLYTDIFGNESKLFEDTAIEEWIRKDPINNSIETWRNIYCGDDRQHANEEGMKLIVDFLLNQPSIQKVFE